MRGWTAVTQQTPPPQHQSHSPAHRGQGHT